MSDEARSGALRALVERIRDRRSAPAVTDLDVELLGAPAAHGVLRLRTRGNDLALKLSDTDTESIAYMARECDAARYAATLGLGPEVVLALPELGALITRYVEGPSPTIASARDPSVLRRVAGLLRALHAGPEMPWEQDLHADLHDEIERAMPRLDADLRDAWNRVHPRLWEALSRRPVTPRPCHNDLHRDNVIDAADGLLAVDWAAAAMGDPAWDVATFASSAELDDAGWSALLAAYHGAPTAIDQGRARLMGALADAYSLAWYANNPDFDPEATARFARRARLSLSEDAYAPWCASASSDR